MPYQSKYWPYEIDALLAKIPLLQNQVNGVTNLVFVSSTAQMTDTSRAYVNTTNGQWYLYENGRWVAKGQYGGVAVDDTLSTTGAAADAKKTGDELAGRVKKTGDTVTGNLTVVGNIGQTGMLNVTRPQGASLPLIRMNNTDTNRRAEVAMDNDGSLALRNHSLESQWQNYTSLVLNTESGTLDNALQFRVRTQGAGGTHTIFGSHNKGMFIDTTLTKAGYAADAKSVGDAITAAKALIPAVDATLSIAGAAADAKAVGDAIPAVDETLTEQGAAAEAKETGRRIAYLLGHTVRDTGLQKIEGPLVFSSGVDDDLYASLARNDAINCFEISNTGQAGQVALMINSNRISGAGPLGMRIKDTAGEEQFYAIFGTHNKHAFIDSQLKYQNFAADAQVTGARIDAVRAAIPAVDTTLTTQGAAADAKATGDAISALNAEIPAVDATLSMQGSAADAKTTGDRINGVSDLLNSSGLSWNVIPPEYYSGDDYTNYGIHFVKQADGSVYSSGTATNQARYYWLYNGQIKPGTYTIGGMPEGSSSQTFMLQYSINDGSYVAMVQPRTITINEGDTISVRTWYKAGYVDEGHFWQIFIGNGIGNDDPKYSPEFFVPTIYQNSSSISEIDERVTALENVDALPDYWESYLASRIPQVNAEIYSTGNHGVVFAFFSDYHYVQSEYNYQGFTWLPNIMKRIKRDCPIETFVFGGDVLTKNDTRDEALAILEKFRKDYEFLDLKTVNGNHDTNPYGGEPVTIDDVYSILFRGMGVEESVNLEPGLYWYFDNHPQKCRIIALNTGEGVYNRWVADTSQHQWLINTLAETPDGYTVITIPHVFFELSNGSLAVSSIGENIKTVVDAYATKGSGTWNTLNYDFTNAGGTIACILCGHTHNDGMIASAAGYPMIGTVCDAMWGSQQGVPRGNAAKNTSAEHAFDVVCVDTAAKKIKCVRIGSGSDREYTYGGQ